MTEFQKFRSGEEPVYACDLCATSKMDPRQVINHVTGLRHRRRFLVNFNDLFWVHRSISVILKLLINSLQWDPLNSHGKCAEKSCELSETMLHCVFINSGNLCPGQLYKLSGRCKLVRVRLFGLHCAVNMTLQYCRKYFN